MFIGFIFGFLVFTAIEALLSRNKVLRKKYWDNPRLVYGYHIHHSTWGLLLIIIGLAIKDSHVGQGLIGLGIAIIIVHTLFDRRFIFIEKQ
ncbi:hypothetical protein HY947_05470 [Candidatus Gottesmanbacteria bacterium]|nr:hypothetical protein [Candidatus Gottesmanbacteria bacterium]